ncbi:MAG: hypothetical protein FWG26_07330 [Betaproteobacteria bacterium]|nr:hypothetical protein [Betaproteobacteria bacterium]
MRFTRSEIAEFRRIGIDLVGVKTQADWEAAFRLWVDTLEAERPDLLEKFARAIAKAKGLEFDQDSS